MGCIYKITNLINGKMYIGQTSVTESRRWQQHVWHAYNNPLSDSTALCNAIKKYGKLSFKREVLEEIDDKDKLNDREIYYINLFNTTDKNIGYNIALGGDGHELYSMDEILRLYTQIHSVVGVARVLGASRDTISQRLHSIGINTYNTIILQFNINGDFINSYLSFADAARKTNLPLPKIVPSHHFCAGYFWIYEDDQCDVNIIINNYIKLNSIAKEVQQYDLNCNYIASFSSASEASRNLNINVSSIKSALLGNQKTAGGYIWHKLNGITLEQRYINYLLSNSCCSIEEVDEMGNIIKWYKSSTDAEKQLGWSYNSIKKVCDYQVTHTHGRIFRYTNQDKRKLLMEMNKQ